MINYIKSGETMNSVKLLTINPTEFYLSYNLADNNIIYAKIDNQSKLVIKSIQKNDGKSRLDISDDELASIKNDITKFIEDNKVKIDDTIKSAQTGDVIEITNQPESTENTELRESVEVNKSYDFPCTDGNTKISKIVLDMIKSSLDDETGIGDYVAHQLSKGVSIDELKDLLSHIAVNQTIIDFDSMNEVNDFINQNITLPDNEPVLEAIRLQSKNRESINDHTKTDYSIAFSNVHEQLDKLESISNQIYTRHNIAKEDQLVTNLIPLIEDILNKYMVEFADLEDAHGKSSLIVIARSVADSVIKWIGNIKRLEVELHQYKDLSHIKELNGRIIVAEFIQRIYEPMISYTDIVREMLQSQQYKFNEQKMKIDTNLVAVIKKLDAMQQNFFNEKFTRIKKADDDAIKHDDFWKSNHRNSTGQLPMGDARNKLQLGQSRR